MATPHGPVPVTPALVGRDREQATLRDVLACGGYLRDPWLNLGTRSPRLLRNQTGWRK